MKYYLSKIIILAYGFMVWFNFFFFISAARQCGPSTQKSALTDRNARIAPIATTRRTNAGERGISKN